MAYIGANAAGGLVDETVQGDQWQVCFLAGCWVFNLGQSPGGYSGLFGWSNPAPGNSTGENILLVSDGNGPIIRQSSSNMDGSCELDSPDYHTSGLTSAQRNRIHIAIACSPNKRQMWFDGVLMNTDTRYQSGPQYFTNLGANYGVKSPVSIAGCQFMSGYPTQADVSNMSSGMDIRDIALKSSARLSAVRQYPLISDKKESTGLMREFLLNSNGQYQMVMEEDVSPTATFDSNSPPSIAWSGKGACSRAVDGGQSYS